MFENILFTSNEERGKYCLLCGQKGKALYTGLFDRLYQAPEMWNYIRCPNCELVWLLPPLSLENLSEYYKEYYTSFGTHNDASDYNIQQSIKDSILFACFGYDDQERHLWKKRLGKLLGCFHPLRKKVGRTIMFIDGHCRGRLLDVGCGTGTLLSLMHRLGWDVTGVEPSAGSAAIAQEKLDLSILNCTLEEAMFKNDSFDVITMHHVLEHLPNPVETLKECYRILKSGGRISIATPNVKSFGHAIFKKSWIEIAPPWHTYLWSSNALRYCFEKIGFTIIRCNTMIHFDKWIESYIVKKLPSSNRFDSSEFQRIYGRLKFLSYIIGIMGSSTKRLGDEIVILAKKD